jgi:hypothetical protein
MIVELRFGINGGPKHSSKDIAEVLGLQEEQIEIAMYHASRAMRHVPNSDFSLEFIDLGLAALRAPMQPPQALADVVESVKKLTPELIEHLRSRKDDLTKIRWDVFEHLVGEFLAHQGFKDVRLVGRDPRTSADIYATWVIRFERDGLAHLHRG